MYETALQGAQAYNQVSVETGTVEASPYQLTVMLFDGAIAAVTLAQHHMQSANSPAKGQAISKAVNIITSGLRASLDKSRSTERVDNLDALYGYMCNRLIMANLKNRPEFLEEVHRLLMELKMAWQGADGNRQAAAAPSGTRQRPRAN